jgi:transcription elongation factor GreA
MTQQQFVLTKAGYEQLQLELADYEARRSGQAEEESDVQSDVDEQFPEEGAEFEARTMREFMDERIGNLKLILERAQVVEEDPDPRVVDPGDRVTVWSVSENEEFQYDLVGSAEVMYIGEGVSVDSPVGQALLGKRVGDVFEVETPDGTTRYAIRHIEPIPAAEG